ncbi:MAG: tetratricopeptide repeat protein [Planctomycetota bacterium]
MFPLRPALLAAACLFAAGGLAYFSSFPGVFLYDDTVAIVENDSLHRFWPPSDWFSNPDNIARPAVTVTLAANYCIGGVNTWGYHAFNLGVHLLAALTLFGIVRRTLVSKRLCERFGKGPEASGLALCVALLWLVHPLQTQAVTYVIQRAEALMGLFFLLTLYCASRGFHSARAAWWHAGAVCCCLLGVGCKPVIATVPLVVLLYDVAFLSGTLGSALRRWRLYAALASSWVLLALLLAAGPKAGTAGFDMPACTPWEYARSQPGVILHYLRLAVWPDKLCLDYWWPAAHTLGEVLPGVLVIGGLLGLTGWALWRAPAWGFLGAWFFVILAPTSSIMPIQDLAVEHRMYLPLAAVVTAVVCGVFLQAGRRAALVLSGVAVLALACRTAQRNEDYRSASQLWDRVVAQRPDNPRARCGLGLALADEPGRLDDAIEQYREALKLTPKYAEAHNNLGIALLEQGRLEEAREHFQEALRIRPNFAKAHSNFGEALLRQGRLDEAIAHCQEALQLNPKQAEAHNNLGNALFQQGRLDEGLAHLQEALRLKPNFPEAHNNLGNALLQQGRLDEALLHYQEALRTKPNFPDAHYDLGNALFQQGRPAEAVLHYQEALKTKPLFVEAHYNLGIALFQQGRVDEALLHYREVLKIKPNYAEAHINFGNALLQQGKLDEALGHYREALKIKPDYPEAHNNLGVALAKQNRRDEAAAHFQEALRLKPDYQAARESLDGILKP